MKIIDTTTFFEEKLMIDLRFNVLDPFVDKFIVCEARFTHSGKEKNINFNKKDYPKFEDKIIHLVIDNDPIKKNNNQNAKTETLRQNSIIRIEAQRNYIFRALDNLDQNDYILHSDNDEIPDLSNLDFVKNKAKILIFKQKLFYYKFNLAYPKVNWFGTKCCKLKHLKNISWLRNIKNKDYNIFRLDTIFSNTKYSNVNIIENGGWHFTNLKTAEELLKKYQNDEMHSEFETRKDSLKDIEYKIKNKFINYDHSADRKSSDEKKQNNMFYLTKVNLDLLPNYILENLEKYKSWID
ncbi:hypothetical protein OA315_01305 [Candidatus Pelagibacter sp.]|nr:hypothetical protein [Candidatus Pelagibacter sp.]